jgi:hypothetical protein
MADIPPTFLKSTTQIDCIPVCHCTIQAPIGIGKELFCKHVRSGEDRNSKIFAQLATHWNAFLANDLELCRLVLVDEEHPNSVSVKPGFARGLDVLAKQTSRTRSLGSHPKFPVSVRIRTEKIDIEGLAVLAVLEDDCRPSAEIAAAALEEATIH